ncbi:MAG: PIN domain-containing protein [Azonexus sp.]|jgi:predicted nucleic acid-binding protein|nr:PIN domain-containing protein [Azonexus sp.]
MSEDSRLDPGVQEVRMPYLVDTLPRGVLADSGPLIALFNAADDWHARVLQWLKDHPEARLISTWPVLTEVCALLARRIHNRAALDFLLWVERGGLDLDRADLASLSEVRRISQRFASLPFDLADASIAEAAARLGINAILSIDTDFDVYRDSQGQPLRNLLRH